MRQFFLLFSFFLASCGSVVKEPDLSYKADFDVGLVDKVDSYFKDLASKRSFEVFEKNRREMRAISQGQEAFYISYYSSDRTSPILWVSNSGAGSVLYLGLLSNNDVSEDDVNKLAKLIVSDLKRMYGIDLVPIVAEN